MLEESCRVVRLQVRVAVDLIKLRESGGGKFVS